MIPKYHILRWSYIDSCYFIFQTKTYIALSIFGLCSIAFSLAELLLALGISKYNVLVTYH